MLCHVCGKKEATVHLTQMLNNEVRKLHLCEQCAAASGIDLNAPASIPNVLLGLGAPKAAEAEAAHLACGSCGMRFAEFRKRSRLGCEQCYAAFSGELDGLLRDIQKGERHVGKRPARSAGAAEPDRPLDALREALARAVGSENYEEAARLRDEIVRAAAGRPVKESRK